jgi:hypothetical protein
MLCRRPIDKFFVTCRHRRFLATLETTGMVMLGGADFGSTTFGFIPKFLCQVLKMACVHFLVQIMHVKVLLLGFYLYCRGKRKEKKKL